MALRLVACAQSGHEISLSSLSLTAPSPKFVSIQCFYHFIQPQIGFAHSRYKNSDTDALERKWLLDLVTDGCLCAPSDSRRTPAVRRWAAHFLPLLTSTGLSGYVTTQTLVWNLPVLLSQGQKGQVWPEMIAEEAFNECGVFCFCLQPEEKNKFDGIFESLSPVSGLLSGDKVKPVLINSKLPLDVLGKVPTLSSLEL